MEKNFFKSLALSLFLSWASAFGQEQALEDNSENTKYYSKEKKYMDFTEHKVKFNSWSIGAYGGLPILHSADLRSFTKENKGWGYDAQLAITKQFTHAFGLQLLGQYGKTKQFSRPNEGGLTGGSYWNGETKYCGVSLLSDLNFTNLLRRVDNKSEYKWALHGYAGPGVLYYTAKLNSSNGQGAGSVKSNYTDKINFSSGLGSVFFQAGLGLKYKISPGLDAELRGIWVYTGDEAFDGSGFGSRDDHERFLIAYIKPGRFDSFLNTSLGLNYTFGNNPRSLFWYDPFKALSAPRISKLDLKVCKKGDKDNDGICDDWDKELNTPSGARIDGSGRAFDVDLDGVIDLYDKCVTVPGPASNQGCPLIEKEENPTKKEVDDAGKEKLKKVNKKLDGIKFDLGKYYIKKEYESTLKETAALMHEYHDIDFQVVGHTDASGSALVNLILSKNRAQSVKNFLIKQQVEGSRLTVVAKGESELKYSECSNKEYKTKECTGKNPETGFSKNDENRRVELILMTVRK